MAWDDVVSAGTFGLAGGDDDGGGNPLNMIGAIFSSPWFQAMTAGMSIAEQKKVYAQLTAATDQQIADLYNVASQYGPEKLATYDDSSQRGMDEQFGLRDRQRQGYYDRYAAAASDIEGYGDQMKADIDLSSKNLAATQEMNLRERGMFGSAIAPDLALQVERDRLAEQRRLGEDLTRQRINLLTGLSGDALQSDERTTGNIAGAYSTDAANRANITGEGYANMQSAIGGVNHVPPPPNLLPFINGQNAVQPAQPQGNWLTNFAGGVAPGVGQGAGYAGMNWLLA